MKDLVVVMLLASVAAGVLAAQCSGDRTPRWRWCPAHRDTLTEGMNGEWRRGTCPR